ncbi:MAG: Mur ligase family protein [Chloroflexota bacterium]
MASDRPDPAAPPDAAAIAALQARGRFGIRLGLGRTRALLRELGSPERELRGALIGGTNGKGSTQAMVASMLRAGGLRVGQTPKPHLVDYRERIVVDGRPIAAEAFAALLDEVLAAADRVERRHGAPTEFETLTAAAFLWFARAGVDVAVVEVGLGGRLDATNAWDGGVAAIVNVQRDHMEYLGDTIPAIAREKAAIIKRGDRAVTGADGEGLTVIRRRAARVRAPLLVAPPLPVVAMDRLGTTVLDPVRGELRLGLLGAHQGANAAVALGIVDALGAAGIARVDDDAVRAGLAGARWPGRLELLSIDPGGRAGPTGPVPVPGRPDLLLDGAHNAAGAAALAAAIEALAPSLSGGRVTLLLGVMRDKEVDVMLAALRSSARLDRALVVAVTVPDAPRSLSGAELAALWRPGDVTASDALPEAWERAVSLARAAEGPLVVAGSLYLVGAVRALMLPGDGA